MPNMTDSLVEKLESVGLSSKFVVKIYDLVVKNLEIIKAIYSTDFDTSFNTIERVSKKSEQSARMVKFFVIAEAEVRSMLIEAGYAI